MKETLASRLGRCYELAALFQMDNRAWTLVHGRVTSPFEHSPHPIIDHAWLEHGEMTYDAVLDRYLPLIFFNDVFEPQRLFSYSWLEAGAKIIETENFGPWDYSDRAGSVAAA